MDGKKVIASVSTNIYFEILSPAKTLKTFCIGWLVKDRLGVQKLLIVFDGQLSLDHGHVGQTPGRVLCHIEEPVYIILFEFLSILTQTLSTLSRTTLSKDLFESLPLVYRYPEAIL